MKQLKGVSSLTLVTCMKIFCAEKDGENQVMSRYRKKMCPRNQLSQEMEQNDFTFFCTQRMSCRFKLSPSVNQMIRFSKQPQCDEASEQTASFFMHSDCVSCIWMQIDWMCRYIFVCFVHWIVFHTDQIRRSFMTLYSRVGLSAGNNKLLTWQLYLHF